MLNHWRFRLCFDDRDVGCPGDGVDDGRRHADRASLVAVAVGCG